MYFLLLTLRCCVRAWRWRHETDVDSLLAWPGWDAWVRTTALPLDPCVRPCWHHRPCLGAQRRAIHRARCTKWSCTCTEYQFWIHKGIGQDSKKTYYLPCAWLFLECFPRFWESCHPHTRPESGAQENSWVWLWVSIPRSYLCCKRNCWILVTNQNLDENWGDCDPFKQTSAIYFLIKYIILNLN